MRSACPEKPLQRRETNSKKITWLWTLSKNHSVGVVKTAFHEIKGRIREGRNIYSKFFKPFLKLGEKISAGAFKNG